MGNRATTIDTDCISVAAFCMVKCWGLIICRNSSVLASDKRFRWPNSSPHPKTITIVSWLPGFTESRLVGSPNAATLSMHWWKEFQVEIQYSRTRWSCPSDRQTQSIEICVFNSYALMFLKYFANQHIRFAKIEG